jgi:hypothetical protein
MVTSTTTEHHKSEALQKAVHYMSAPIGTETRETLENKSFCELVLNHAARYMLKTYARQESNL